MTHDKPAVLRQFVAAGRLGDKADLDDAVRAARDAFPDWKPAGTVPLLAVRLAEALQEAGLPDGVLSSLVADSGLGGQLVEHPGVDAVTFTGSNSVGRRLIATCGELARPIQTEVGKRAEQAHVRLLTGGEPYRDEPRRRGAFVAPTILELTGEDSLGASS